MTEPAWYAAFATAATVLAVAGLAKTVRPHDTARALRAGGWPTRPWMVRAGGAAEAIIGLAAVLAGGRLAAALLAVSYAALATFVAAALVRQTPLSSCGCFGEPDTPPTVLHVLVDAGLAAAGYMAFVHPLRGLPAMVSADPSHGLVLTALVGLAAYAVITALTAVPRLTAIGAPR